MTLTQDSLQAELRRRLRSARPGADLPGTDSTTVVSVLRRFDLVAWIRGTVAFAAGLSGEQASAWRAVFTRTVFLTGNPDNLRTRFTFDHIGAGADVAWLGPAPARQFLVLRRLLKLFDAPGELPPHPQRMVDLDGEPTGAVRTLYIATAGTSVAGALVNVNHLLAEAVLDGVLRRGDRLRVRQVPRLVGLGPFAALRVGADPTNPDRLRAYAGIVTETE